MDNLAYFNGLFKPKEKPKKPLKEKDVFADSKKPNKIIPK
jgi:hypothetical protein